MANIWEYIYNEALSWVVDWVNKEFTTLNDIYKLEEVYIGWVAYRDVTFTGNVITFADAPTEWDISADYFQSLYSNSIESTWSNLDIIYWEDLNWVVDWINKVFTTVDTIYKIEEVYVGWAAYKDVTFDWNEVTFEDAPPVWSEPTIDYFKETELVIPAWYVSFINLIDEVYEILGTNSRSPIFPMSIVKRYINKGIQKVKNEKFFKDKVFSYTFNKARDTSVIEYWATEILTSAWQYVPTSWAILLWSAMIEYSSFLDGKFWAQAKFIYDKWDKVSIWYKLPSWIKKTAEVLVWWKPLTYIDNREFSIWSYWYTIFHWANWDRYLFLPYWDEQQITVKYITDTTIYENDTDLIDIMYEYSDVVALYAAYKLCLFREDDRWQAYKQEFLEEKNKLKAYKSRQTDWINNKFRSQALLK